MKQIKIGFKNEFFQTTKFPHTKQIVAQFLDILLIHNAWIKYLKYVGNKNCAFCRKHTINLIHINRILGSSIYTQVKVIFVSCNLIQK